MLGVGEAPAELWWTGEDAFSVRNAIERYLAPAIVGRSLGIRAALDEMNGALAANPYAKAAVEMALWDLLGKAADLPLYALLGGGPPLRVPIKYVVGAMAADHAAAEAARGVALGFDCIKVKVGGGDPEADYSRVAAVRDQVGHSVRIGVDANQGWDPPLAAVMIERLAGLQLSFIEQPVSAEFPAAMAHLTACTTTPIVAHESIFTRRDALDAAQRRLADIWAVTPSTHGGLLPALDILAVARAAGVPCLLGSTVELGVATAFLAHIGAATPEIARCSVPSDVIGPLYHEGDIVAGPAVTIEGGFVTVVDGPGLGVELSDAAVERYRAAS